MLRPPSLLPALVAVLARRRRHRSSAATPAAVSPCRTPRTAAHRRARRRRPCTAAPGGPTPPGRSRSRSTRCRRRSCPGRGPVRVTGSVTNNDDATWTDINLLLHVREPMTTSAELDAKRRARPRPPTSATGSPSRAPTTPSTSSRPARHCSSRSRCRAPLGVPAEPGVYWFGVHALGAGAGRPRLDGADGRARTFLPLVPPHAEAGGHRPRRCPLRHDVAYAAGRQLDDVDGWTASLGRTAGCAGSSTSAPPPATRRHLAARPRLIDAAQQLVAGNPPLRRRHPDRRSGDAGRRVRRSPRRRSRPTSPSDGATRRHRPTTAPDADDRGRGGRREQPGWSACTRGRRAASQILALPYGDLDVAAAAEHDPRSYEPARRAQRRRARGLGPAHRRPRSPRPRLPRRRPASPGRADTTTVLVTDRMFAATGARRWPASTARPGRSPPRRAAPAGGPGPGDPLGRGRAAPADPQRGGGAARSTPGTQPLVVVLPPDVGPRPPRRASSTASTSTGSTSRRSAPRDRSGRRGRPRRPGLPASAGPRASSTPRTSPPPTP